MVTFYRLVYLALWEQMKDAVKNPDAKSLVIYNEMMTAESIGGKNQRLSIYGPASALNTIERSR